MERRQSTRIPFKAPAVVLQNGETVLFETQNISKHGIFFKTSRHHNKGENALVSICLRKGRTTLSMTLRCAVTRVSESGIGCTAPDLEPETLLFMSNLIHAHKVAPAEFMRTFYGYMDWLTNN